MFDDKSLLEKPIVHTNMYEIMNYWIKKVAPKYFDMKHQNLNRLGLFGYVNETMSHITESSMNENSVLLNEFFFKKAVLPSSIYSYASTYLVNDINAKPARMRFALIINEDDIINNATMTNKECYFVIDSDSEIILENKFIYSLDYDIKINIKKDYYGNYVYTAKYLTKFDNPLASIKKKNNPYIKMTKTKTNNTSYLILYVDCGQYNKITEDKYITSTNFLEYFSFDVEYNKMLGQLADFKVMYKEPNSSEYIQLEKRLIDTEAIDKPFCYYQYKSNNRVNITFSTNMRFQFRPKFNSNLRFIFYNTNGKSGNFKYSGKDVRFVLKSQKYDYRNTIIIVESISDSMYGSDILTYEDIKRRVSTNATTCNEIGTEKDLNLYFSSIQKMSDILFVKKRDDVKMRLNSAYLLLRDSDDNIVPTNTLSMELNEPDDFDFVEKSTKRYMLKQGASFIYKPSKRILIRRKNESKGLMKPLFEYVNPFTMIINRDPYMVEYYLNGINKTVDTDYYMINDKAYLNFIINNITFKRNPLNSDYYSIKFKSKSSITDLKVKFAEFDEYGNFVKDNNVSKMLGVIYDDNGSTVKYIFNIDMIDADMAKAEYFYEAKIYTDDYITQTAYLRTTKNVINIYNPKLTQPFIGSSIKVGLLCFIKNDEKINETKNNDFNGNISNISKIIDIDNYTLCNEFKISEDIKVVNDLNKLTYSTSKYSFQNNSKNLVHLIEEVPVIKKDYIMQEYYGDDFISNFINNFQLLKDNLSLLTNAFNISTKFYNTYGKSYYYYVNEKTSNTLDRVNISINLRIKLQVNHSVDSILKEEIRKFIRHYIEEINGDINLYISNLIQVLENNFREIIFINFKYLNNYSSEVQSIEKNFPTNTPYEEKHRYKNFVPEFININKPYLDDNSKYDVNIQFV